MVAWSQKEVIVYVNEEIEDVEWNFFIGRSVSDETDFESLFHIRHTHIRIVSITSFCKFRFQEDSVWDNVLLGWQLGVDTT